MGPAAQWQRDSRARERGLVNGHHEFESFHPGATAAGWFLLLLDGLKPIINYTPVGCRDTSFVGRSMRGGIALDRLPLLQAATIGPHSGLHH